MTGKYAIIVTDHQKPDEPIAYVNKAYEDLTGYKLAEVIGFHPHFLRTNDRDQVGIRALEEAIKNGTACSATLRDFRKNGTPTWYQVSVSPIFNGAGQLTHFFGFLKDVTEIVAAKQSEEDFDTFLGMLAHDMRTPLAGADRMFALILEGAFGELVPDLQDTINLLSKSNKKALLLVTNLLETYRLQKGIELMHFEPTNLADLIEVTVAENEAALGDKLQSFRVVIADNLPSCRFDKLSISRLLTNLLDNAAKFSPDHGEILISAESLNNEVIILRVSDTGIGIASEDRELIFKKCKRGKKQRKYASGCGLGLYTCDRIVKAHHGRIDFISEMGVGTTFVVILPVVASSENVSILSGPITIPSST